MRLAVVQLDSKLKNIARNIQTVETLLKNVQSDLVVLPEMALTGYNFQSRHELEPFINDRSLDWAKQYASEACTNVILGYPEQDGPRIYNSAALVGPDGQILANYRKTQLYSTDKQWGASGGNFTVFGPFKSLPFRVQIGICMDLNPNEFRAPWHAFEFARSCRDNQAQLAVIPCAWEQSESTKALIDYWCARQPYMIPTIFANRCGIERGTIFGGASTVRHRDGSTQSLQAEEGVLIADL